MGEKIHEILQKSSNKEDIR